MNTQLAADEEVDEVDEFEREGRLSGLSLRDGGTDLFRGVLVALIALTIGAVVLTQGSDDDGVDSAADEASITTGELTAADPNATLTDDEAQAGDAATDPAAPTTDDAMADGAATEDATTDGASTASSDPATTTLTTAPALADTARPAGDVEVVVLNATDRKGIAGQGTELLGAAGYATVPAGNATNAVGSVIYYLEGYRADAIAVSQVFTDGLEGLVQPYDPTSPPAAAEDIGDAKVIVVLGVDDAIPIG